jgi:hypothetical protein
MILDDAQYQLLELPIDVASPGREQISASIQEQVDYQKRGALVSICKTVISRQRLRERRNLAMYCAVIPREGPPDRRLDKAPIAYSWQSAETKRLLVRLDDILDFDAVVPYGGSALRQALERIGGARRSVAYPRRRALRSERPGLGVPMNGRTRAQRRSHSKRFFAARVPDRPVVTLLRSSIRHGESIDHPFIGEVPRPWRACGGRYFWLIQLLSRTVRPPLPSATAPARPVLRRNPSPLRRPHQKELPCPPSPPPRAA